MDILTSKQLGELIRSIAKGNGQAIGEIYQKLKNVMYSVAITIVKRREDVDDVLQESLWKIVQNAKQFRENKNAYSWINTIVKNTAIDYYRKNVGKPEYVSEQEPIYQFNDDEIIIREALSVLKEDERDLLIYSYWYKMTLTEIGAVLHISKSAVEYRRNQIIKFLQEYFKK